MATSNDQQVTFVFEVCSNCGQHQWNTRHVEVKYAQFFADCAAAVKELIPNSNCVMNRVPKPWYEKEVYCQLIPNEDDNNPYYDILPRIGAFEVSTVHENTDILFYSKQMSTMWPHAPSLAARLHQFLQDTKNMPGGALKQKYTTSGRQVRAPRKPSSRLAGGYSQASLSTRGGNQRSQASLQQQASQQSLAEPAQDTSQQPTDAQQMQAPQLQADLQRDIDAQAEDGFIQWRDNSTPQQKAVGSAEVERWTKDPAFAAEQEKFMAETFAAADANKDSVLDFEEFKVFIAKLMEDGAKRGNYEDPRPQTVEKSYLLADRINPSKAGVSIEDWGTLCFALVGKTQELKSAAGL